MMIMKKFHRITFPLMILSEPVMKIGLITSLLRQREHPNGADPLYSETTLSLFGGQQQGGYFRRQVRDYGTAGRDFFDTGWTPGYGGLSGSVFQSQDSRIFFNRFYSSGGYDDTIAGTYDVLATQNNVNMAYRLLVNSSGRIVSAVRSNRVVQGTDGGWVSVGSTTTMDLSGQNSMASASFNQTQEGSDPDPWRTTKSAAGVAVITSAADGPVPVGEIVGAAIIIGAVAWDLVRPAEQGNLNYPGPWTTTKPDPTIRFYGPSGNSSYEPPDPEGLPPEVGVGVGGALIGLKLLQDSIERNGMRPVQQDATKYVSPRIGPR
jgi:hypothetical protein